MSEPKLVSPLLDGFVMGPPMSDHDGVCCCPAMKENSDNKYIVKVISIPASQVQLDALLLTGAYKDPAAAMDYFKDLSDGILGEAELLRKLSRLEGFHPFENWQVVPMDEKRLGYQVYLLSDYRKSLEKYMRRNPVTHLNAVNLGLDMCAAMAICRNAGYLYVDLKPSNIFISEDKEFRVGDIGFVPLASLKYASLPNRYYSSYTAPEMRDAMATPSATMDIYAIGMILYQIYNNGILPFEGFAPEEELPSPLNADYEIAEIIMKAISPDPSSRWQDPMEMGQALVSYMQRNVINDVPINPPLADLSAPAAPVAAEPETGEAPQEEPAAEVFDAETPVPAETAAEEPVAGTAEEDVSAVIAVVSVPTEVPDEEEAAPADSEELQDAVLEADAENDSADASSDPDANDDAEDPDDQRKTVILPADQLPKKQHFSFFEESEEEEEEYLDESIPETAQEDIPAEEATLDPPPVKKKKKKTGLVVLMIVLVLIAALCYGGYYVYRNYYQINVTELDVSGLQNQICVTVDTDADPSLLTVVCSDSYGNTKRMTLTNGQALFTDLSPDTMYQIQLEVNGYHEIVGPKSGSYTTAAETRIQDFTGITGTEDGTVILSFSVEGPESEWVLHYSAEGEEEGTITFSGHTVNVSGLTVGKAYTFTLEPTTSLYIVTEATLEFTASSLILAQELEIVACSGGTLTAQWTAPEGAEVEDWTVLCYGDNGYSSTVSVQDTTVTFENIDPAQAYTVEVTAAGMTQPVRTSITANAISIGQITVDESDPMELVFSWDYEGAAPEGGWLLMYTLDNNETQNVVRCDTNSGVISPRIPKATYSVTILSADATTIFTNTYTYVCPDAEHFSDYSIASRLIDAYMLVTPKEGWTYKNVKTKDYTDTFQLGESISILLHSNYDFYLPKDDMHLLYVIRDEEGNVIESLLAEQDAVWYNLWYNKSNYHYCELDLPNIPTEAGSYTLDLYFNGRFMSEMTFTITE